MGWTSRPPPAASWRTFSPLWPPIRPRFAPNGSAPVRKWPGPLASTWEGPPESNPHQGDSGARHSGSTDEDRGGTNRQHCPGNRTVPSHSLSGSRSTRRGCEVRPGRQVAPVEARAPRPRRPWRSPPCRGHTLTPRPGERSPQEGLFSTEPGSLDQSGRRQARVVPIGNSAQISIVRRAPPTASPSLVSPHQRRPKPSPSLFRSTEERRSPESCSSFQSSEVPDAGFTTVVLGCLT